LLEYIEKNFKSEQFLKNSDKYSEATKQSIKQLEDDLLNDWRKFKENPYWMVKEWNDEMN
jgi:hypothetical protein